MRCLSVATAACAALYILDDGLRAAAAQAATYTITDLGSLGGGRTTPMAINNRGAIVGFSKTAEGHTRGFLYTGGSPLDLGTLGGDESFAYRINDAGLIAGRAQDETGRFHAFVTTLGGGAITLSSLDPQADGDYGAALAINTAGDVAGYFTTAGPHMAARNRIFLYRDFNVTDLGTFGGEDGVVVAINDAGNMAGFFSTEPHADYAQHQAVLATAGGGVVPIGSLGGKLTTARDLNNRNEVVGDGDTGDGDHHAFLFADGRLHDLGTLAGGRQSAAYAINDRGDIVGFSDGPDGSARAILITGGVMRDLNGLIASNTGWVLTHARDINDPGSIVGIGWLNGEQRGFLLTP